MHTKDDYTNAMQDAYPGPWADGASDNLWAAIEPLIAEDEAERDALRVRAETAEARLESHHRAEAIGNNCGYCLTADERLVAHAAAVEARTDMTDDELDRETRDP